MRRRPLLLAALPWPAGACAVPPEAPDAAAQTEAWHAREGLRLRAVGLRLHLLDDRAQLLREWPCSDLARRQQAPAVDLRAHAARRSFVVALPGLGELWEIQLAPDAPPIHDGLVHDHRLNEAIAQPGQFGIRRSPLGLGRVPVPLLVPPDQAWVAGPLSGGAVGVVHLDVRREVATWPARGAPRWDGTRLWCPAPQGGWTARRPPRWTADDLDYCAG